VPFASAVHRGRSDQLEKKTARHLAMPGGGMGLAPRIQAHGRATPNPALPQVQGFRSRDLAVRDPFTPREPTQRNPVSPTVCCVRGVCSTQLSLSHSTRWRHSRATGPGYPGRWLCLAPRGLCMTEKGNWCATSASGGAVAASAAICSNASDGICPRKPCVGLLSCCWECMGLAVATELAVAALGPWLRLVAAHTPGGEWWGCGTRGLSSLGPSLWCAPLVGPHRPDLGCR
jgi:hypothetical protein